MDLEYVKILHAADNFTSLLGPKKRWRKLYNCPYCSKRFSRKSQFFRHSSTHMTCKPFQCPECKKNFRSEASKAAHMNIHIGNVYKCEICFKDFVSKYGFQMHQSTFPPENAKTCEKCGKRFHGHQALAIHNISEHEKKYSCYYCKKNVENAEKLRQHLTELHNELTTSSNNCEFCGKVYANTSCKLKHIKTQHLKFYLAVCDLCGKELSSNQSLKDHLLVHAGEKPLTCEHCGKTFTKNNTLKVHLRKHTGAKPYTCQICQKSFTQSSSLNIHIRKHTGVKPYSCNLCPQAFISKNLLNAHTKHKHKTLFEDTGGKNHSKLNDKIYKCPSCLKILKDNASLIRHISIHVEEHPKPECTFCDKAFKNSYSLKKHVWQIHVSKSDKFQCKVCERHFNYKTNLIQHVRRYPTNEDLSCPLCNKKFHYKNALQIHLAIEKLGALSCYACDGKFHSAEALKLHASDLHGSAECRFRCQFCGKPMACYQSMMRHMKATHLGACIHICDICGKTLSSRSSLRDHMLLHTGERPITCEQCGKTFTKKTTLAVHQRIHTGAKPYSCQICGKSFTQISTLTIHKRKHTGDKPYSCNLCSEKFVSKSCLRLHQKSRHKLLPPPNNVSY